MNQRQRKHKKYTKYYRYLKILQRLEQRFTAKGDLEYALKCSALVDEVRCAIHISKLRDRGYKFITREDGTSEFTKDSKTAEAAAG